jgi:hypothetical protein
MIWMVSGCALILGLIVGALGYARWHERMLLEQRRVPRQSRIIKRALVNSRELRVWRWLGETFTEHCVMVKIPVTRFTTPLAEEDREKWFALLSDVYCTFTVATVEGKVVGCVDVPGVGGISKSNLLVKRRLFARCELPYWVVESDKLPRQQDLYNAFVSEAEETKKQVEALEAAVRVGDVDRARAELRATVLRQRNNKVGGPEESPFADSILTPDWAPDSFNAPLDSRQSDLT